VGYNRRKRDTRKSEDRRGGEAEEEPTCMYLVKWKDRGYKKVERTNKQRSRGNGMIKRQNSAGVG